jgi:hypothetical protein
LRIKVINSAPGKLVVAEQHALTNRLESDDDLLAVFHLRPARQWVLQSIDLPIAVGPDARVLMRASGMTDADCLGLRDELALLTGHLKRVQPDHVEDVSPSSPKRPRIIRETAVVARSADDALAAPASILVTVISETPRSFPRAFVSEMAVPMNTLDSLTAEADIKAKFGVVFLNTLFVKKTYYKHRLVYRYASQTGLIADYVARGCTDEGKWSLLVNEV